MVPDWFWCVSDWFQVGSRFILNCFGSNQTGTDLSRLVWIGLVLFQIGFRVVQNWFNLCQSGSTLIQTGPHRFRLVQVDQDLFRMGSKWFSLVSRWLRFRNILITILFQVVFGCSRLAQIKSNWFRLDKIPRLAPIYSGWFQIDSKML